MPFVKSDPRALDGFFEAEAAGLSWLAQAQAGGGARIVKVLSVGSRSIELEQLVPVRATPDAAAAFGRALAVTQVLFAAAHSTLSRGGRVGRVDRPCRRRRRADGLRAAGVGGGRRR